MTEADQLSHLIGNIYDAALHPALWIGTLAKCAHFIGGSAASLFSKDAANKTGNSVYDYGIDAHFEQLCFEKIKLDPLHWSIDRNEEKFRMVEFGLASFMDEQFRFSFRGLH